MKKSFHLISLGCAKNLVDSEVMLGGLVAKGWTFEGKPSKASALIINTCGFIQSAVEEAIEEILELVRIKRKNRAKKIVVVGCLVQRYGDSLAVELPEVDMFVGTEDAENIAGLLDILMQGNPLGVAGEENVRVVFSERKIMTHATPRLVSTPPFRAWLKITEGCNNRCAYCMIPAIRGPLRSRSVEDILREAQRLELCGLKELCLVAQDTTAYGMDLQDTGLLRLMKNLVKETGIPWIRLLYLYPAGITDAMLDFMAVEHRIVPYLDIPMQHVNSDILHKMNRRYSVEELYLLIGKIRHKIPEVSLRTTFLTGFPGESEKHFLEIEQFMKEVKIDHVGVFAYSNEEGCPSEYFADQIEEGERIRRRDHLLAVQAEISKENLKKFRGRIEKVLIEGASGETDLLLEGRTRFQAPEVDGVVYINDGQACAGDIVDVRIDDTAEYDLIGSIIERA